MKQFIAKFHGDYNKELNSMDPNDSTDLFWQVNKEYLVKTKDEHISDTTEFAEAYGYDGYDFMQIAREKGWTDFCQIGERPYSIFLYRGDELLNYIEGDLIYYKVKDDN